MSAETHQPNHAELEGMPKELEPQLLAGELISRAFTERARWVEQVPSLETDQKPVGRLIKNVADPDGDMGNVKRTHIIGASEVGDGDTPSYIMEVSYPYADKKLRIFYELHMKEKSIQVSVEEDDQVIALDDTASDAFTKDFMAYAKELLGPFGFKGLTFHGDDYPLLHPHFREI